MSANPNDILLKNNAALVVKFNLAYNEDGQDKTIGSGDMTVGQTRTERFPASVTGVRVTPSYHTGIQWADLPDVTVTQFPAGFFFTGSLFNVDIEVEIPGPPSTSSVTKDQPAPPKPPTTYDLLLKYAKDGSLKNKLSKQTMFLLQEKLKAKSVDEVPVKLVQAKGPESLQNLLGLDLARRIIDELKS
jgi:hypothetical protein